MIGQRIAWHEYFPRPIQGKDQQYDWDNPIDVKRGGQIIAITPGFLGIRTLLVIKADNGEILKIPTSRMKR